MIDNLIHQVNQLETMELTGLSTYAIKPSAGPYAFLTLHRPSNVDDAKTFRQIAEALNRIAADMPVFFPVHPRTKKMIAAHGINLSEAIVQLDPLGFKEALFLWKDARVVLTDSGGLQEESTALKIPCLTLRNNTERPITVEMGSNILAGTSTDSILDAYREAMARGSDNHGIPPKWDGKASERIWLALLGEPSPALTRTT
jgi:UDP-N-acetylglucosamine 2-epimerase (non-hydrolysing)